MNRDIVVAEKIMGTTRNLGLLLLATTLVACEELTDSPVAPEPPARAPATTCLTALDGYVRRADGNLAVYNAQFQNDCTARVRVRASLTLYLLPARTVVNRRRFEVVVAGSAVQWLCANGETYAACSLDYSTTSAFGVNPNINYCYTDETCVNLVEEQEYRGD